MIKLLRRRTEAAHMDYDRIAQAEMNKLRKRLRYVELQLEVLRREYS